MAEAQDNQSVNDETTTPAIDHSSLAIELAEALMTPHNAATTHMLSQKLGTGRFVPQIVFPEWNMALVEANIQQGNGTPGSPVYTGAENLRAAPALVEVTIDPSDQISTTTVKKIQETLAVMFQASTFQRTPPVLHTQGGLQIFPPVIMKLHPWAVINWVNFFTGLILGSRGIAKINRILSATTDIIIHPPADLDTERSMMLSHNSSIPHRLRMFFRAFARAMDVDLLPSNSYVAFTQICAGVTLRYNHEELVADLRNDTSAESTRTIRYSKESGRRGLSCRDQLTTYVAANMCWRREKVEHFLRKFTDDELSFCAGSLTGGFLMFVDIEMMTLIVNNNRSALPALMPIVKAEFPELMVILGQLYDAVYLPLTNDDTNISNSVAGTQIDTIGGGMDMVGRIRAVLG